MDFALCAALKNFEEKYPDVFQNCNHPRLLAELSNIYKKYGKNSMSEADREMEKLFQSGVSRVKPFGELTSLTGANYQAYNDLGHCGFTPGFGDALRDKGLVRAVLTESNSAKARDVDDQAPVPKASGGGASAN